MINLLPPDVKQEIVYGRKNSILFRWILAILLVIVGIAIMSLFGQFYITNNVHSQQKVAKLAQDRMAAQNLDATKKELQTLSDNVKTIVQILSKQLLFSKMLTKIGGIIPPGTVLSDITLSTTDTAIDLSVSAVDRAAATQAFVNINDPNNNFFSKADLISINCESASGKKYPCTAQVRVTLKNDSSFYFLNSVTTSGAKN